MMSNYLNIIYCFIVFISISYLLLKKRRLNFLTIYLFSSVVYYLPLILNKLFDFYYDGKKIIYLNIPIEDKTYIFGILNITIVLFWIILNDRCKKNTEIFKNLETKTSKNIMFFFSFINIILIFYSISKNYYFLFVEYNKVKLMQNLGLIDSVLKEISMFIAAYSFGISKSKFLKKISVFFLFYFLFMGRRIEFVIIIIIYVINYFNKFFSKSYNIVNVFNKNPKSLFFLSIFALIIFPLKKSLPFFRRGEIKEFIIHTILKIFDKNVYSYSEATAITTYIDKILKINFRELSYKYIIFNLVPFKRTLGFFSYNFYDKFQQRLYPSITIDVFGLGGTFWGEIIANGGLLFFVIMLNIYCFYIIKLEKYHNKTENIYLKVFYSLILAYSTFYIHRLFMEFLLGQYKLLIVTLLLFIISDKIFKYLHF